MQRRQYSGNRPHSENRGGNQNRNRNFYRGGGRNRSRGGRRFTSDKIDYSRYINKAKEVEAIVAYVPQNKFNDFDLSNLIKKNIAYKKYVDPTPIQDQSIPHILEGKDLVGIANTGTGKTAAFLLPFIDKVLRDRKQSVLILAPTRELALQIDEEFRDFAYGTGLYSALCIGGMNIQRQIHDLRRRPNFIIGTPGRIKDLYNRRNLNLSQFQNIVLDEVDRMLDMGFVDDIKFVLEQMPENRQSLFFSATMPQTIQNLISTFLKDPITVSVKTRETTENVEQDVIFVQSDSDKLEQLLNLVLKPEVEKTLVFMRTKHSTDRVADSLNVKGIKSESIHGDKSQSKRIRALDAFKKDRIQVLIATDVAARGLDISGVTHVINYDEPANYEDYVHRIGRTGRGNKRGTAYTFVKK